MRIEKVVRKIIGNDRSVLVFSSDNIICDCI